MIRARAFILAIALAALSGCVPRRNLDRDAFASPLPGVGAGEEADRNDQLARYAPSPARGTAGAGSKAGAARPATPGPCPAVRKIPGPPLVVAIDPGHGGKDPGTAHGALREKDLTLQIANRLAAKLREAGATVRMTRDSDRYVPLQNRVAFARESGADLFISVHVNAAREEDAQGSEIIYNTIRHQGLTDGSLIPRSKALAEGTAADLKRIPGLASRGVKPNTRHLYVLKYAPCPAILVECGFVTNAADRRILTAAAWQDRIAYEIYAGVYDYRSRRGR